ncbi:unnamed protein product, partial [Iphiclides podalirius]
MTPEVHPRLRNQHSAQTQLIHGSATNTVPAGFYSAGAIKPSLSQPKWKRIDDPPSRFGETHSIVVTAWRSIVQHGIVSKRVKSMTPEVHPRLRNQHSAQTQLIHGSATNTVPAGFYSAGAIKPSLSQPKWKRIDDPPSRFG